VQPTFVIVHYNASATVDFPHANTKDQSTLYQQEVGDWSVDRWTESTTESEHYQLCNDNQTCYFEQVTNSNRQFPTAAWAGVCLAWICVADDYTCRYGRFVQFTRFLSHAWQVKQWYPVIDVRHNVQSRWFLHHHTSCSVDHFHRAMTDHASCTHAAPM